MESDFKHTSILHKLIISFVLMSIIPMLFLGYLIANFIMPQVRYDMWLVVEILIIVFIIFLGLYIVGSILKSVVTIGEQAKKVIEGTQVEVKVVEGGEVGELATSLNQIIARIKSETTALEKSQHDLDGANRKLLDSYTKLHEANEKLKKMDQMKSDFVANVAHELISPLATIREMMELLRSNLDAKMDPNQKEVMDISKKNIVRLIRLVTDILDVSRIEAGKMELKTEDIDVSGMVDEILIPLDILFKKKKITFVKKITPRSLTFEADRDKIIQAITNLLVNAAKYTPDGGEVFLTISAEKDDIIIHVEDTGAGIDVKDQDRIFDKFERISVDKKEGTGLGLTITKDIIALHKGRIWVESEQGKGAKFIFTIPK